MSVENIRNIAIIAHVDHGKTTLVDAMFRQSGTFKNLDKMGDRVMDSGDIERERGITISAKNCEIQWDGIKINILDTPGHADFGGEVERALSMVDGVVLLVDAAEGPLPQTRFVLQKALALNLELIILINKIDREDARPEEVYNEVLELLLDLGADDRYLDAPVLWSNGRKGIAKYNLEDESTNIAPLMETIIKHIPAPECDMEGPFQMLVADLDYSDYLGRMAIGKIRSGKASINDRLAIIGKDGVPKPFKVSQIQVYNGTSLKAVDSVPAGDIAILSGVSNVFIGDTICSALEPAALPRIEVDEPTVSMRFLPNNSPLSGREGKYVQGSKIFERLKKETLRNVALQVVEATDGEGGYIVKGRGEFQMAILIEMLRREGYEFCVGRAKVIFKTDGNGNKTEPMEHVVISVHKDYAGTISETLMMRKGLLTNYANSTGDHIIMEFDIPSRALIGYRDKFLTDTKGTGIMNAYFIGYGEYKGDIPTRLTGSLVADRSGEAVAYGIFNLEPRGKMFIVPGDPVYEGMVVGEHNRDFDLYLNPTKTKQLSNMRASGKDTNVILTPVLPMTIERAINTIRDDELVEITPQSIRLRKKILNRLERKKTERLEEA
ncbi:MAG: translational GTPase TypA [Spirochaetia bacterium]|nr:translational GTPase TypA [Spirochaetia bacterium]MBQ3712482.1 translational GTPase TypA [Spirochaetia bacterium]MBR0318624.1 translational GTPase TypA [Spirochaetia bacterium]